METVLKRSIAQFTASMTFVLPPCIRPEQRLFRYALAADTVQPDIFEIHSLHSSFGVSAGWRTYEKLGIISTHGRTSSLDGRRSRFLDSDSLVRGRLSDFLTSDF